MLDSSIYDAVKNNDIETLREYYRAHPDMLDAADDGGYTMLMEAAKQGRLEIVQCLVELGANLDASCEMIDHYRDERGTALAFALANFQREVAVYLIQEGAEVNTAYYLSENEGTPDQEKEHRTCFMYAMDGMDTELLELMLKNGLQLNEVNAVVSDYDQGVTPLFYAIGEVKLPMVKWLLAKGADPLKVLAIQDMGEVNALMYAVHLGLTNKNKIDERYEIVDLLLKAGVDFTRTYDAWDRETVLDLVVDFGNERYIRLLGLQNIQEKLIVPTE